MTGKIVFPIIAALLPVIVSNLLVKNIGQESLFVFIVSGFVSFVLLVAVQGFIEALSRYFNNKNKYCGHWIEEMTFYEKDDKSKVNTAPTPTKRMIGMGIIRFDRKTDEYVFDGNTYDLDGTECYAWTIDYLYSNRDDSVQYVCSVQIPGERSIGQITFFNRNECNGTIWIMDGSWYKFNGHRIKEEELSIADIKPTFQVKRNPFYHGMMMCQQDISKFVRAYSQKRFPPLDASPSGSCASKQGNATNP